MSEIIKTVQDFASPKFLRSEVVEEAARQPRSAVRLAARLARETARQTLKGNIGLHKIPGRTLPGVQLRGEAPEKLIKAAGLAPFIGEEPRSKKASDKMLKQEPWNWQKVTGQAPAAPLVGVELNPGPQPKSKKPQKKKQKNKHKKQDMRAPVAVGNRFVGAPPRHTPMPNGGVRIHHTEFLTDITTGTTASAFSSTKLTVNPNNVNLFPWLSTQARGYERYRFVDLKLHYYADCPTSTAGSVMLLFDVDPTDPIPTSKLEFMSHDNKARANAWLSTTLNVSKTSLNRLKSWFVRRASGLISGTATSDLDVGSFGYAYVGIPANTYIGELSIEYTIEFMNPGELNFGMSQTVQCPTVTTDSVYWPNALTAGDDMVVPNANGTALFFKRTGYYLVYVRVIGLAYDDTSNIVFNGTPVGITATSFASGNQAGTATVVELATILNVTQVMNQSTLAGGLTLRMSGTSGIIQSTLTYVAAMNPLSITTTPAAWPAALITTFSDTPTQHSTLNTVRVASAAAGEIDSGGDLPSVSYPQPEDEKEREFMAQQIAMYRFGRSAQPAASR